MKIFGKKFLPTSIRLPFAAALTASLFFILLLGSEPAKASYISDTGQSLSFDFGNPNVTDSIVQNFYIGDPPPLPPNYIINTTTPYTILGIEILSPISTYTGSISLMCGSVNVLPLSFAQGSQNLLSSFNWQTHCSDPLDFNGIPGTNLLIQWVPYDTRLTTSTQAIYNSTSTVDVQFLGNLANQQWLFEIILVCLLLLIFIPLILWTRSY